MSTRTEASSLLICLDGTEFVSLSVLKRGFARKFRGTQREYSSKPLKHSIVERI